jgi:hypothetical protein
MEVIRREAISDRLRSGMSRIELLVAVGIALLAIVLVPPAIQYSREASRKTECRNNLKQLALAIHNYHETFGGIPFGCVGPARLSPSKRWSWYPGLGTFVEYWGMPQLNLSRSWDDPSLRPLLMTRWEKPSGHEYQVPLSPYLAVICPSAPGVRGDDDQPFTYYVGVAGIDSGGAEVPRGDARAGVFAYEEQAKFDQVADGMSQTLMLIETASNNGCWLAGGPPTVRGWTPTETTPVGSNRQFGGIHPGCAQAALVNGAVKAISESIDPGVFKAMSTIAGGESIAAESVP